MNKEWGLDLRNFPVELKLMLGSMKSKPADLLLAGGESALDWQEFSSLSMHHRVYPTIHAHLSAYSDLLPAETMQWLNHRYHHNTFTMLQLSGQMQKVSQAFNKQDIPALQLKGPVLAQLLYGDLSRRTSKDLDVLVPMDRIEAAEQTLLELGYTKTQEVDRTLDKWKWRYNHESYTHERTGVEIELHWRLNGDAGAEQSFDDLWTRKQTMQFGGTSVHMLGKEDLLIYLAVHGARHAWFRLRWLADIDRLVRMDIDWELLTRLARQYKSSHIIGQAFLLSAALLETPVTPQMEVLMNQPRARDLARRVIVFIREKVSLCPEPETERLAQKYRSYQYALRTNGQKALFWWRKMTPDAWDMQTLPLPKPLHFMYYPLHPFLLLYRRNQRRSALQREVGQ
ncbi:nucleotidyltransferase family protein [Paenibacillus bovis]|uniref:Renal dipeptidase n=1 Tax=Paenibacillus bovis TaxID=1616788 RepID=A0A172ZDX1_9BACL|nr:nucleotidyltransferase family protein [Paenibacillus bovis]ANF95854.1 hypothetical protein AR543_07435 [Paenibacillus bovis]